MLRVTRWEVLQEALLNEAQGRDEKDLLKKERGEAL